MCNAVNNGEHMCECEATRSTRTVQPLRANSRETPELRRKRYILSWVEPEEPNVIHATVQLL